MTKEEEKIQKLLFSDDPEMQTLGVLLFHELDTPWKGSVFQNVKHMASSMALVVTKSRFLTHTKTGFR